MADKKKTLAEMIRGSVGEASIAAMGEQAVAGERTIENITSEILHYQAVGGDAVIQIGKRLIEAKEMLPHGGWLPWLSEQVNYSERTAQRLMKIARECSNPTALSDLGQTKALMLLTLPDEEQKNLLEAYDVPNMSTRELEDAIRERDEARKAAADFEEDNKELAAKLRQKEARVKELEDAPKEVYRDEDAIKAAADDARAAAETEWKNKVAAANDMARNAENMAKDVADKLKAAEDKLAKAEEKAKKAAEQAKTADADSGAEAEKYKAEADRLRAELETVKREQTKTAISGDADLAAFQLLFEAAQENVNKMRGILLKVRGRDEALAGKLTAALTALADAVRRCAA